MVIILDDARKPIRIEVTKNLDGLSLDISKIQFVVIGNRQVTDVKIEHKIFDRQMVWYGKYINSNNEHDITIVQEPNGDNFRGNIKISNK